MNEETRPMFRSNVRQLIAVPLLVGGVVLLGACGQDQPSSNGGGKEGGGATSAPPAAGKVSVENTPVCEVVPEAGIRRMLGRVEGAPQDVSVQGERRCQYTGAGGKGLIVSHGLGGSAHISFFTDFYTAKPVDGIGEDAAAAEALGQYVLTATNGNQYLQFAVDESADSATVRSVMTETLATLA
jgi:hypothetical protein